MKNQTTKKLFAFIVITMMFSAYVNTQALAQCNGEYQVWVYKQNGNGPCKRKCADFGSFQWYISHGWTTTSCFGARLSSEADNELSTEATIAIYPNPVSTSTTISLSLSQSQKIALNIFDLNGRLVTTLADKVFEEGENEIVWSAEEVNAGIYFLQFQSAETLQTEKLIVTK